MSRMIYAFIVSFLTLVPALAHAELRVDVTKGTMDPIPIAITDFVPKDASGDQISRDIPGVISSDLESTGLFKLIDSRAFIQDSASMQTQIPKSRWFHVTALSICLSITDRPSGGQ